MASLNLQSNTAQAAMNPLNTSLTTPATTVPYDTAQPTMPSVQFSTAVPTVPNTQYSTTTPTIPNTQYNTAPPTMPSTQYNSSVPTMPTQYNTTVPTVPGNLFNTPATSSVLQSGPSQSMPSTVHTPVSSFTGTPSAQPVSTPYTPFNPTVQGTPAPIPVFQTPTLVPTPVSSGPQQSMPSSEPALLPGLSPDLSSPGSTVTAKPAQLLMDITAGATPAPLIPVSTVQNGENAAGLQPSPQLVAQ